jgi:hypothetical protein
MGKYKFNPISSDFDMTGSSGASVVDGEVATPADLPITLGTPDVGSVYLALSSSGVWLVNYKPSGLYKRVSNDGDADDWSYLGAFDGKFNNDVEITDSTKGLVLTNGTNRVRLTLGADNQLVRTILPLLLVLGAAIPASAQIARDLGLDASNRVVTGITNGNPVTFTNPLAFGTNAATTITNLFTGNEAGARAALVIGESDTVTFADVNAATFLAGNATNYVYGSENGLNFYGTTAATTRTNLGLGSLATNNSVPSGAAVAGTPALADGAGGTAFSTPTRWTVSSGTVTSNAPALTVSQTWNSTNTNDLVLLIVTNTASGAESMFVRMQAAGVDQIGLRRDGSIFANGIQSFSSWLPFAAAGSGPRFTVFNGYTLQRSTDYYGWASSGTISSGTAGDLRLWRDAAGSLGQRDTNVAQTNNIYGSFTNSTNYRRLSIGMSNSGIGFIRPEQAGPSTNGTNFLYISGLPATNTGLPSGVLWNSNGTVVVNP